MQRGLLLGFFTVIAFTVSMIMVFSVITSHGNEIGHLFKYVLVLAFFTGALAPKASFSLLLVLCLVIDLCKRLMVVSGRVSALDLYYVLGIPPVLVAGIAVSALISVALGRMQFRKFHFVMICASALIMAFNLALTAKDYGFSPGVLLPVMANLGIYTMFLFLVPMYFKTREELTNLVRTMIFLCVPVAIYGVAQKVWGYQDFEIAYLKTGLTMEIKQLESGETRPFSTLNSPTALGAVCATMAAFSLIFMTLPQRLHSRSKVLAPYVAIPLAIIFIAGLIASTSRTSIAVFPIILGGYICFTSKSRTSIFYGCIAAALILLTIFAPTILQNLNNIQTAITDVVGQNNFLAQITVVGTYTDRLQGFINLTRNPKVYTLFGHGRQTDMTIDDDLYSHDVLTNNIITYGVVPVLCLLIPGIIATARAHIAIYNIRDPLNRTFAATCIGAALAYTVISVLGGSVFKVFPINVLLWLFLGSACLMAILKAPEEPVSDLQNTPTPPLPHPLPQPQNGGQRKKPIYHFTKSGSQNF